MPGGSGASAPPAIADEPLRGGTKIKGFSRANEGVLKAPRAGVRHAPARCGALSWWLWRLLLALCAGVPILVGGFYLIAGTGGLYWVATGVLVTLAATVWNGWVLLVEILR